MSENKVYKLAGSVQNYAWGGYTYIANWLGVNNEGKLPMAEYWLGTHTAAPSKILVGETYDNLSTFITSSLTTVLGEKVEKAFGELPFLLKILDVREMLSIQVHPSKEAAKIGFDRENEAGIPLNAPNRNYKDANHKPEVMIALSDFWLLHGFLPAEKLNEVLINTPAFEPLISAFANNNYSNLYSVVNNMPQTTVDEILLPLVNEILATVPKNEYPKNTPQYWVNKLYNGKAPTANIDRGVFSIYFFNIVYLAKGEGIFQAAGVPHAYLEGQNVELMANSDNVLRGGLTPKHIDVTELLQHTICGPTIPNVLKGNKVSVFEKNYPCPVADFGINALELPTSSVHNVKANSLEIWIVLSGKVLVNGQSFTAGNAFAILANSNIDILSEQNSVLYRAFTP